MEAYSSHFHTSGIAQGFLPQRQFPEMGRLHHKINLQTGGKVTSHLAKYSHHPDGRAHFSQDGKVRTEIKRQSVALGTQNGHLFSLLIQGLEAFDEADDTKDVGSSPKRTALTFQIPESVEAGAVKFVGRWLNLSMISAAGPSPVIGPTILTQDPDGKQQHGFLVANPFDEAPHRALCITSQQIPIRGPEPEIMCFYGGFATREVMDDTTMEAGFLGFLYPASNGDQLKARIGTIDR